MRTRDVRILDPIARQKRAERWVASLNRVNYSANSEQQERIFELVDKERERRQKLRREREASGQLHGKVGDKRKKQVRGDHYKTRFRKTFDSIREEEETRLKREQKGNDELVCYRTMAAPASIRPARKICQVCGDWGRYKCVVCGTSYCRIKCKNMSQMDWRNTQEYKDYASGPREPKHQGSCHWAPMEQRTADDIAKMEQTRSEYEAWLRHKGITLRNAEDNYGNPNQEGKKTAKPPGAVEQYQNQPDPSAPRPKAKGRGEMLKRTPAAPPSTATNPLSQMQSHHDKAAAEPPKQQQQQQPAGIVQQQAPVARGRGRGRGRSIS